LLILGLLPAVLAVQGGQHVADYMDVLAAWGLGTIVWLSTAMVGKPTRR